uniref:Uncharacterized protein n=1 Tax=Arundo donax TaxID=35708 RepID=A0A0A9DNF3_ARUDO
MVMMGQTLRTAPAMASQRTPVGTFLRPHLGAESSSLSTSSEVWALRHLEPSRRTPGNWIHGGEPQI